MAKNNTPYDPYRSQQEAIRKAKGNPNKNQHHKKNNSNYGGGDYLKEKASQKAAQKDTEKVKLPLWLKICLGALFVLLIASLILRLTVYKDNLAMNYASSLLLGLTCGALFYTRRFRHTKKDGKFYGLISALLAIMAVIYGGMGIIGLLNILGVL